MKLPLQTVLAFVILHVAVAPSPPKMMMMGGGMGPMMMSLSAMGKMSNMGKMSSMGMMTMGKMSDSMSGNMMMSMGMSMVSGMMSGIGMGMSMMGSCGMSQTMCESSRRRLDTVESERTVRSNPGADVEAPELPEKYSFNPVLDNVEGWESFDLDSMSEALQCEAIPLEGRPVHGASTWRHLRETYEDVVGSERSSITHAARGLEAEGPFFGTPTAADSTGVLRVVETAGKGRGLVASRDIKKGEQMWSDVYFAAFHNKRDLNRFLAVLPVELACDVILWTYNHEDVEDDEETEGRYFYYTVDLDLGSFCNDGGLENTNVDWRPNKFVDTALAARDIKAGEEILCDYEDYENEDEEDDYDDDGYEEDEDDEGDDDYNYEEEEEEDVGDDK